jgi:hypothetical protein
LVRKPARPSHCKPTPSQPEELSLSLDDFVGSIRPGWGCSGLLKETSSQSP